jgi:hypothetical protein
MINPSHLGVGLACALVVFSVPTVAQPPAAGSRFAITPIYRMDSDLDSGGEARYGGLFMSLGRSWSLDARSSLGFGLDFGHLDWRFDNPGGFGGVAPWDQVNRFGLSAPFTYGSAGGWTLGISPTVEYSGESGAELSDALEYGALVSMVKPIRDGLTLGLGFGVYERIEETSVFPVLIVNWRINERLRLSNPVPAGPSGPAGLELSYALGSGWELGFGGAYRSNRYRLDQDGPFPNGVGEYRRVPVLARIGRRFSDALSLNLYAGVSLSSELRVEDSNGRGLYKEDLDPAATFGLSLAGRF